MALVQGPNDANLPVPAGDSLVGRVKITDGTDVAGVNTDGSIYVSPNSGYNDGATVLTIKRAFANVAASQTDANIVTAVSAKKIRVIFAYAVAGATATNLTFNSKPAGAGTAISALFANGINGGEVLPPNQWGWFETTAGEGLTVTTGAGSTTGIGLGYVEA